MTTPTKPGSRRLLVDLAKLAQAGGLDINAAVVGAARNLADEAK
jgi:hypothetical protein